MVRITISRKNKTVKINGETWCLFGLLESWGSMQSMFTTAQKKQILRAWVALS